MDRQLKKQCHQHIQYLKYLSMLGNGDKSFDEPIDIKCMVTGCQTVYVNLDGEQYVSNYTIYVDETCPIMNTRDEVIVIDDRRMPVQLFTPYYNEKGLFEGAMLLI